MQNTDIFGLYDTVLYQTVGWPWCLTVKRNNIIIVMTEYTFEPVTVENQSRSHVQEIQAQLTVW